MDTPGDDNFLSDAAAALRAVDGVVMVADAIDGVKVQGEKIWQFVDKAEGLPALVVVNKMDRERADFEAAVNMIPDMLGIKAMQAANSHGRGREPSSAWWTCWPTRPTPSSDGSAR